MPRRNPKLICRLLKIQQLAHPDVSFLPVSCLCNSTLISDKSTTDQWMDKVINQKGKSRPYNQETARGSDPYDELNRFFAKDPLSKFDCPDVISWFGVSLKIYFVS